MIDKITIQETYKEYTKIMNEREAEKAKLFKENFFKFFPFRIK